MAPDGEVVRDQTFVVWADPGLMTGLAWYDLDADVFGSGQYGATDLLRKLDDFGPAHASRMILGYERFIVTSGGPRTSTPEHAIAACAMLDEYTRAHLVPLARAQPSSSRNLGSVVYLRRLGWYKPGRKHANDAAQHLLADLLKRRPMPQAVRGKLFPGYSSGATIAP